MTSYPFLKQVIDIYPKLQQARLEFAQSMGHSGWWVHMREFYIEFREDSNYFENLYDDYLDEFVNDSGMFSQSTPLDIQHCEDCKYCWETGIMRGAMGY